MNLKEMIEVLEEMRSDFGDTCPVVIQSDTKSVFEVAIPEYRKLVKLKDTDTYVQVESPNVNNLNCIFIG